MNNQWIAFYKALSIAFVLIVSTSTLTKAQNQNLNFLIDSNCTLFLSLTDTNNNILSNYPPYLFSVGQQYQNNNALALESFDLSNLPDSFYTASCIDGNQAVYTLSFFNACFSSPSVSNSFISIDSLNDASNCPNCNGTAVLNIINPNSNFTFEWSNGFVDSNTTLSFQNGLCPGNYFVLATDSLGATQSISFEVGCTNYTSPITTCNQSLTLHLDLNGQARVLPQDLSSNLINPDTTAAFIIDNQGQFQQQLQLDCSHLGYSVVQLLTTDLINNQTNSCPVIIQVQDSLYRCNSAYLDYSINGAAINSSSCNVCDGLYQINSITFNNGQNTAVPPYSYLWNNQYTAGPTITGLCPYTQYSVTVIDANGNLYEQSISIDCNSGSSPCYDANLIDSSFSCPTILSPVCGCNGLTYANACIAQYEYGIFNFNNGICQDSLTLNANVSSATFCDSASNVCNGKIILNTSGGTVPYLYTWNDSTLQGPIQNNLCPGNYIVTISDANGNSISRIVSVGTIGCVWPGDADDNGVANNFDLLAIGLAYNEQGIPRNISNNNWAPINAFDWQINPIAGLSNHKHIDCDGSGRIDSLDQLIIVQNYGQRYLKSANTSLWGPTPFYVESTSAALGDSVQLDIILGDSINNLSNVYGLAFTIEYDTALVDTSTVDVLFNNSWLGNDLMDIQRNFGSDGAIEVAVSRKDQQSIPGFGRIGSVDFTIKDDVWIGKVNNPGNTLVIPVSIRNIRIIDQDNNEVGSNPQTATVEISLLNLNSLVEEQSAVRCFPNPAQKTVHLRTQDSFLQSYTLYAIDGRILQQKTLTPCKSVDLSVQKYPSGVYLLEIQSDRGLQKTRLIIQE